MRTIYTPPVEIIESTVPPGVTLAEWRRSTAPTAVHRRPGLSRLRKLHGRRTP